MSENIYQNTEKIENRQAAQLWKPCTTCIQPKDEVMKIAPFHLHQQNRIDNNQKQDQGMTTNSRLMFGDQEQGNPPGGENPGGEDPVGTGEKQAKKKQKKPIAIKAQDFESEKGVKKLYQLTNQVNWDDRMSVDSAMNLVVMTLKSWHFQFKPKYSTDYFLKRCQAIGSDRKLTSYMHKVRRIHKGQDNWQQAQTNPTHSKQVVENEGLQLQNKMAPQIDYNDSPAEQPQQSIFRERAEIAKNLGHTSEKGALEQEMEDLMDEDLRMFEEMNRRRNHEKDAKRQDHAKGQVQDADEDEGMELGDGEFQGYEDYDD